MPIAAPELFWLVIGLVLLALALTIFVFRRRLFDRGYRVGKAANPAEVRRENPPDRELPNR
jgi:hypothetical protein